MTKAPLSVRASRLLNDNFSDHWGLPSGVTTLLIIFGLIISGLSFLMAIANDKYAAWGLILAWTWGAAIMLAGFAWGLTALFVIRSFRRQQARIIADNEDDYDHSLRLKVILDRFQRTPVSDFPVVENPVAGRWNVFRVEHFVGVSGHGSFSGTINFRFASVGDQTSMVMAPNLLEASSILFLQSGRDTMRVLLPNPASIREMVAKTLRFWLKDSASSSHVGKLLHEFQLGDNVLIAPLHHPQLIDRLDLATSSPAAERPDVTVIGQIIQPGVVLASALQVDGRSATFLPSGLFHELAEKFEPYLGELQPPQLVAAIN